MLSMLKHTTAILAVCTLFACGNTAQAQYEPYGADGFDSEEFDYQREFADKWRDPGGWGDFWEYDVTTPPVTGRPNVSDFYYPEDTEYEPGTEPVPLGDDPYYSNPDGRWGSDLPPRGTSLYQDFYTDDWWDEEGDYNTWY